MDCMDHSYEEIRAAALDILAGRERCKYEATQYESLMADVAEVLVRRGGNGGLRGSLYGMDQQLSESDKLLFQEAFWDLFLQRIITIGLDDSNREFPFFRVSSHGKRILDNQETYFFHDVATYEKRIRERVPAINSATLVYLKEAMQAFRAGCILSATVMLGVATEHTFDLLLETILGNPKFTARFGDIGKERSILRRANGFKKIVDSDMSLIPATLREDLETQFAGILSIIRSYRNESGHPTGRIIDREQAYVLLNLFVPYCEKMYGLMTHFKPE